MQKMQFHYVDIVAKEEKETSNYFIAPTFLTGGQDDFGYKTYNEFFTVYGNVSALYLLNKKVGNLYSNLAGLNNLKIEKTPIIPLVYSPYEIANAVIQKKRLATIKPNREQLKAIRGIIHNLKPREDQQIYFGQLFFDQSGQFSLSKDIISIYCIEDRVGIFWNNRYHFKELKLGTNYKKYFECLNGLKWNKNNYKDIILPCLDNGRKIAKDRVDKNIRDVKNNVKKTSDNIRSLAKPYRESVVAIKKYTEVEKMLPTEVLAMLNKGKQDMEGTLETVREYAATLSCHSKKLNEFKEIRKFNNDCAKKTGSDFKQVNDLIKQGIIEKIEYKQGKGLRWVYSPLTYKTNNGSTFFLGRVAVTLNELVGSHTFNIEMPSYNLSQIGRIGTWHWYPSSSGSSNAAYCLGSFDDCLHSLVAQGRISDLIIVMRDYLLSCNEASKYSHPEWAYMAATEKPRHLTDDSWEVWQKNKDKKAVIISDDPNEEEESEDDEDDYDVESEEEVEAMEVA